MDVFNGWRLRKDRALRNLRSDLAHGFVGRINARGVNGNVCRFHLALSNFKILTMLFCVDYWGDDVYEDMKDDAFLDFSHGPHRYAQLSAQNDSESFMERRTSPIRSFRPMNISDVSRNFRSPSASLFESST